MPHPDLLTISLLITNACLIILLLLFKQLRRDKQTVTIGTIENNIDMTEVVAWLNEHIQPLNLTDRLDRIDHDHQQIKTRLADEEKADQKARAAVRRKKAKA